MAQINIDAQIIGFNRVGAPPHPLVFIGLEDLPKLKLQDLLTKKTAQDIRNSVLEIEYSGEWGEALDYQEQLSALLQSIKMDQASDLGKIYAEILQLCAWIGWQFLPITGQIDLLSRYLYLISNYINVRKKIFNRLSLETDINIIHSLRLQYVDALRANEELIGRAEITIAGEVGVQRPTVSNWLADYDQKYERTSGRASIEEVEYTNSDANTRGLTQAEKDLLRHILQLYDFLFFPDLQKDIIVTVERAIPTSSRAPVQSPSAPAKSSLDLGPIAAAARALLLQTRGEAKVLYDRLDTAVRNSDRGAGLALLLLLAQLRQLDNLLADDERFRALAAADLKASGQDDMVEGLRLNPTAPHFIARFLKIVLQDKLGLPEVDALYFAERLGLVLAVEGEKYSKIVTRGPDGGLKWNL